jgi:hypothetical protein
LEFFLARLDDNLFLHFELIPDHLPERLKSVIAKFPKGTLQFEIGIQTFNLQTQTLINRRQDNEKTESNIIWLRNYTHAHLHTDLIIGLPAEDVDGFADGFNRLVALNPHEIQLGILKRLRGTPIIRHSLAYNIKYNPYPPYNILSSNVISFAAMQELSRFSRYWDLIANSGRFPHTKPILLGDAPFQRFMRFSNWLFNTTQATHNISLNKLFEYLYRGLTEALLVERSIAVDCLGRDYNNNDLKGNPSFMDKTTLRRFQEEKSDTPSPNRATEKPDKNDASDTAFENTSAIPSRQARHIL